MQINLECQWRGYSKILERKAEQDKSISPHFLFFFFWRVFLRKHFSKRENNWDRKMKRLELTKRLSITKEESLCLLCQFHYFVAIYLLVFKFLFLSNIRSDLLWSTLTFIARQKEPLSKVTTFLTENLVFDIKVLGSKAGG